MNLSGLLPLLKNIPAYQKLLNGHTAAPQSLYSAARAFVVAGLATDRDGPVLVLTGTTEQAQHWVERLELFLPPQAQVSLYAEPDALPYERIPWSSRTRQLRLTALATLQQKGRSSSIIVASARALLQKTLPAKELRLALQPLRVGSFIQLDTLTQGWVQNGYEAVEIVEEPGTFARRGGIIDIWPPNLPHPLRIDLFGDEIDTLRIFDPATQRSEHQLEWALVGPGSEALSKYAANALKRMQKPVVTDQPPSTNAAPQATTVLDDPKLLLAIREEIDKERSELAAGHTFRGIEWYLPYFYSRPASILEHLPANGLLVIDDGAELTAQLQGGEQEAARTGQELRHGNEVPEGFTSSFFSPDDLLTQIATRDPLRLGHHHLQSGFAESVVEPSNHAETPAGLSIPTDREQGSVKRHRPLDSGPTPLARAFAPGPRYGGQSKRLLQDMRKLIEDEAAERIVLVSRQAARLQEELRGMRAEESTSPALRSELDTPPPSGITILQGEMAEGFVMSYPRGEQFLSTNSSPRITGVRLLTDTELFGWTKQTGRKKRRPQSTVAPELFFADIKPNDHIVHMEHGIGIYEGLIKLQLGGVEREYLQVNYAKGDKLYVPVHQADRLSRYVGTGDAGIPPAITRLGTADWQTVKARAKKSVEDIAEDLLTLYTEREVVPGYAFSPDTPWQEEMEMAFPFQETEDQTDAIADVMQDMEASRPMDRIIIGDVGYGKTEVAIRAAFKAVMDGKQAAMLVPTTVLAQQHYHTFNQRLRQFPVHVEMLSRFRTPAQQARVLQEMRDGTVDIVIGTHRLLSKDIEFRVLGLLIIDEEQRFGVSHKERLKQIRTQVDVLTLSATPIPRTLHMSLSGVRDMSIINTPPRERLPVRTILSEYDNILVRQAIQRELERDGQVFFVHNRVRGLETLAVRVQRQVPDAVVAVAHGQMPERELEETMIRFAEGDIDVLVCTTIVENGLDIRRANTMIVNRADHFGLAQLYQLRGRVGRGAVRGYCYLLYDQHKSLTFDARRRLEALMESSEELGAGFRIAMRDLEIRGAGELLGARQHGQIANVGFDLYTRLLAQSINELREKKKPEAHDQGTVPSNGSSQAMEVDDPLAPPVALDLPLRAEIPETYVKDQGLRLQLYRRIAGVNSHKELDEMRQEMIDRFGKDPQTNNVPAEIENLFYQILVKMQALKVGIPNIGRRRDQISIRIPSETLTPQATTATRRKLQNRLRMALGHTNDEGQFVPETSIHVGREAIYIPIDEEESWRALLLRALEMLPPVVSDSVPQKHDSPVLTSPYS